MDASAALAGRPPATGIVGRPATELAAPVRSGELSAVEVVRAHLAQLTQVGSRIGAFRVVRTAAALAEAVEVDASPLRAELPLAGVPVAVKDNVAVTGETCTMGPAAHHPAPTATDHPVVARLRAAGAVVVGNIRVASGWTLPAGPRSTPSSPTSRRPGTPWSGATR